MTPWASSLHPSSSFRKVSSQYYNIKGRKTSTFIHTIPNRVNIFYVALEQEKMFV
jgi:hypothetical protein